MKWILPLVALGGLAPALRAVEAPLPVTREPHHRVALENNYVRILDVLLAPGEQTLYHVHRLPSVVVELSRSVIASQEFGSPAPPAHDVTPGDTRYAAYDEKPLVHQVTNRGRVPFHVMDIELLRPNQEPPDGFPPQLPRPAVMLFQKKQVRAYRLMLDRNDRFVVPASAAAYLLISYSGPLEEMKTGEPIRVQQPGEATFVRPETGLTVTDAGDGPAAAILLELETTGPIVHGRVLSEVSYLGPDRLENLDLYLPAAAAGAASVLRHPALVWIHGGGFTGGDKAQAREKNVGQTLSSAGFVVASINYRMGPGSWPQNVRDAKNAIRYLRAHAADYGVDPQRIAVGGGSAGAYLALMVGLTGDQAPFDPGPGYEGISDQVGGVVDFYGPSDFTTRREIAPDGAPTDRLRAQPTDSPPVFGASSRSDEVFRVASPIRYVSAASPPILICQGRIDPEVDYFQSIELADALKKAGVRHELHLLDGVGHSFDLRTWKKHPLPEDLPPIVIGFLNQSLGLN